MRSASWIGKRAPAANVLGGADAPILCADVPKLQAQGAGPAIQAYDLQLQLGVGGLRAADDGHACRGLCGHALAKGGGAREAGPEPGVRAFSRRWNWRGRRGVNNELMPNRPRQRRPILGGVLRPAPVRTPMPGRAIHGVLGNTPNPRPRPPQRPWRINPSSAAFSTASSSASAILGRVLHGVLVSVPHPRLLP